MSPLTVTILRLVRTSQLILENMLIYWQKIFFCPLFLIPEKKITKNKPPLLNKQYSKCKIKWTGYNVCISFSFLKTVKCFKLNLFMFEYYLKNKNIYTQTIHLGFFSRFFLNYDFYFWGTPKKKTKQKTNNLKTKTKTQQQSKRYMKNIKGTENL